MEITLESSVTAPVLAKALPHEMVALVFRVMLACARIVPWNVVVVPRVAELPTSQYTLGVAEPLVPMVITEEADAVVSADPIWKTKSVLGLPPKLRVSAPVNWADV